MRIRLEPAEAVDTATAAETRPETPKRRRVRAATPDADAAQPVAAGAASAPVAAPAAVPGPTVPAAEPAMPTATVRELHPSEVDRNRERLIEILDSITRTRRERQQRQHAGPARAGWRGAPPRDLASGAPGSETALPRPLEQAG